MSAALARPALFAWMLDTGSELSFSCSRVCTGIATGAQLAMHNKKCRNLAYMIQSCSPIPSRLHSSASPGGHPMVMHRTGAPSLPCSLTGRQCSW